LLCTPDHGFNGRSPLQSRRGLGAATPSSSYMNSGLWRPDGSRKPLPCGQQKGGAVLAPPFAAEQKTTSCLPAHRPERRLRRACAALRSSPPSAPRRRDSLCRHIQNLQPAIRCCRQRSAPPVRPRG